MDNREQRIVIKYFFLKGWGYKKITTELTDTLEDDALSMSTIQRWVNRFKSGDLSCNDLEREGRPNLDISDTISAILQDEPYSTAKSIASRLCCSVPTVIFNLTDVLHLKRFIRRWVPHQLTPENKIERVEKSRALLKTLYSCQENNFISLITLDESWFYFDYETNAMYAPSIEKVPPRVLKKIGSKKCMITIAFSGDRLICIDALPKGIKFNQEYFITNILDEICQFIHHGDHNIRIKQFILHMDNSRIHNGSKTSEFLSDHRLKRVDHPAYSPDLSPCDFWLFGRIKQLLEEKKLESPEELISEIQSLFNEVTFEELQSVFQEWIERLNWVISNNGEYYIKQ